MLAEVLVIWLCLYLLAVHSQLRWLDLVAFCSYKYVGMIASVGLGLLGGSYVYYGVLGYTALAISYFLVSSSQEPCMLYWRRGGVAIACFLVSSC